MNFSADSKGVICNLASFVEEVLPLLQKFEKNTIFSGKNLQNLQIIYEELSNVSSVIRAYSNFIESLILLSYLQ